MNKAQKKRFTEFCKDQIALLEEQRTEIEQEIIYYQTIDYKQYVKLITCSIYDDTSKSQTFFIVSDPDKKKNTDTFPQPGRLLPAHPNFPHFRCFVHSTEKGQCVSHLDSGFKIGSLSEIQGTYDDALESFLKFDPSKDDINTAINRAQKTIVSSGLEYPVNQLTKTNNNGPH